MEPPDRKRQRLEGNDSLIDSLLSILSARPPGEASSSSGAAPQGEASGAIARQGEASPSYNLEAGPEPGRENDWRRGLPPGIRIRNRAQLAESLYHDDCTLAVDEAFAKAAVSERGYYRLAIDEFEYQSMISDKFVDLRDMCSDWREGITSGVRTDGWTFIFEAIYEKYVQMSLDEARRTALMVEQSHYEDGTCGLEYKEMVTSSSLRGVRYRAVSEAYFEELDKMPQLDPIYDCSLKHLKRTTDMSEDLQRHIKGKGSLPTGTSEDLQKQRKGKEQSPTDTSGDLQRQRKGKEPLPTDMSKYFQRLIKGKYPLPSGTSEDLQRHIKGQGPQLAAKDLQRYPKGKKSQCTTVLQHLLTMHRDTISCLKNTMLLFNQREPTSVTSRQQLLDRLHKLRAGNELASSLDELTKHINSMHTSSLHEMDVSSQEVQITSLKVAYELAMANILEAFSKHIKNKCNCQHGATADVDTGSASVDLNSKMNQPDKTLVQQPLAELQSDSNRNAISPQQQHQQQQQLGPNQNQTDTSLDDALLVEFKYWLNMPQGPRFRL